MSSRHTTMFCQRMAWQALKPCRSSPSRRMFHASKICSNSRPMAGIPLPYITEVSAGGWRTSDIFSKLLQERIICLNGPIDDTVSAAIVAQLLWLESDNPDKPITMYINSPGGDVSAGLAIYDTMTYVRPQVSTVCVGSAASMGAILLLGGEAGKRFALPHSTIMVHQPHGGTRGQATDILIYATQIVKTRDQVNNLVMKHLNMAAAQKGKAKYSIADINDMMERDRYMTAQEAKEVGIIDEILQPRAKEEHKEGAGQGKSPATPP